MHRDVIILVAEDDDGHARLIKKNLARAGVVNKIMLFTDGRAILDFLFRQADSPHYQTDTAFVLLLDIRMPHVDGLQVLQQIKADPELCKLPVIMVTTTDDPRDVARCHELGCNTYITKPVNYDKFVNAVRQLGLFLSVVQVPKIRGAKIA